MRFEVVGSLWGTLEVSRQARVVNISRSGALLASPVPAALDSIQTVKLMVEGHEVKVTGRVRHLKRVTSPDDGPHYRLGLEFLEAPTALVNALE